MTREVAGFSLILNSNVKNAALGPKLRNRRNDTGTSFPKKRGRGKVAPRTKTTECGARVMNIAMERVHVAYRTLAAKQVAIAEIPGVAPRPMKRFGRRPDAADKGACRWSGI